MNNAAPTLEQLIQNRRIIAARKRDAEPYTGAILESLLDANGPLPTGDAVLRIAATQQEYANAYPHLTRGGFAARAAATLRSLAIQLY